MEAGAVDGMQLALKTQHCDMAALHEVHVVGYRQQAISVPLCILGRLMWLYVVATARLHGAYTTHQDLDMQASTFRHRCRLSHAVRHVLLGR